jgi:SRSO17 transposase
VARKDQELRPVMTRIPEGLRRRLEREAKWRRRSMNAEIVDRLQESFDAPDLISGIVDDISSEIDSLGYSLGKDTEKIMKSLDAILARLPDRASSGPSEDANELPTTKAEEAAQKAEREARTKKALEEAIQTIERAGFNIARLQPDAAQPKDDGEKK